MQPVDQARLSQIKPSFATRRLEWNHIGGLDANAFDLKPNDLVVARVDEIGQHARIERPDGRRALLFPGDEILIACGARYAPDQFEADCPTSVGPAHLAAAGGVAGLVQLCHAKMNFATRITILGALCNHDRRRINLADYAVSTAMKPVHVPVLAICGTSMNSGKTHTVASLARGFALAGRRVAAIKVTGTGAGGDLWSYRDSGADVVSDFTDAGFATTYRVPVAEIAAGARRLIAEAEAQGAEVVLLEIADGLRQAETAELLRMDAFRTMLRGVIFAAGDALGAEAGVAWLTRAGHRVQAISGRLTASPLAIRETEAATGLSCLTQEDLWEAETVRRLIQLPGCTTLRNAA